MSVAKYKYVRAIENGLSDVGFQNGVPPPIPCP